MKEILCKRGLLIISVDDEDYDKLVKDDWITFIKGNTYYARRNSGCSSGIIATLMHRVIMSTPEKLVVHHIDGNGLNNQKSNLINCTIQENSWYRKGKLDGWCKKIKREDKLTSTELKDIEYYNIRNMLQDIKELHCG